MTVIDKTSQQVRLAEDLYYVRSQEGLFDAASQYFNGRHLGAARGYRVVKTNPPDYPCLVGFKREIENDMRTNIIALSQHIENVDDTMFDVEKSAKQKIEYLEQKLNIELS